MYRCIFNHFYAMGAKSYLIRRNNANYTACSTLFRVIHTLVPIESLCNFLLVINTNLPPILHCFQVTADYWSNFSYRHGSASVYCSPLLGDDPLRIKFTFPETRGIVLPDAESRMIVSSFVWTQYRNVTDRQMDGIPLASTSLCIADVL